jgi:hypothetical protein
MGQTGAGDRANSPGDVPISASNLRIPSGLTVICAQSTAADSGFNFPRADFCGSLISDELTIETDK